MEIKNISLHNIFKYSENEEYNLDKQKKYYLVVYGIGYSHLNDIYFRTDLPISQSINKFHTGHNYQYLEASLEKNVPSYFNVDLLNTRIENNINLYIINKTEINYNQLQFDIKCILEYEPFLDAIKSSFNESNNLCFVINKDDFNSNIFHIIFNDTQKEKHEKLILRIIPKINMNIKLFIDKYKTIYKFYANENNKKIEDSFIHQIYEISKNDLLQRIIYNKHYNGLKLYARNGYDFNLIKMGSVISINNTEFLEKYAIYSKFLIIIGQNDCDNYVESNSSYKVIDRYRINDYSICEFTGYYRIPFITKREEGYHSLDYYDIIIDYVKQYLKNDIHFINYTLYGYTDVISYYPKLQDNLFEETNNTLKEFQIIKENKQHLILIRLNYTYGYDGYLDFVSEVDHSSQTINLDKISVNNYIIIKNKKYTFNYEKAEMIKIELIDDKTKPKIYFENKIINFDNKKEITLKKENKDFNLLYIEAPLSSNVVLRLITFIDINNLEKTNSPNLYKYEGKYIYNYNPKKLYSVRFDFKSESSKLRLLKEENDDVKICYNVAKMIILEEKGNNCFNLKDKKILEYKDDYDNDNESYLTFYSNAGNEAFSFQQIDETKRIDLDDKGSSNTLVIVLIVIAVIILIIVGIIIFFKIKNKHVSSYDIEKV